METSLLPQFPMPYRICVRNRFSAGKGYRAAHINRSGAAHNICFFILPMEPWFSVRAQENAGYSPLSKRQIISHGRHNVQRKDSRRYKCCFLYVLSILRGRFSDRHVDAAAGNPAFSHGYTAMDGRLTDWHLYRVHGHLFFHPVAASDHRTAAGRPGPPDTALYRKKQQTDKSARNTADRDETAFSNGNGFTAVFLLPAAAELKNESGPADFHAQCSFSIRRSVFVMYFLFLPLLLFRDMGHGSADDKNLAIEITEQAISIFKKQNRRYRSYCLYRLSLQPVFLIRSPSRCNDQIRFAHLARHKISPRALHI